MTPTPVALPVQQIVLPTDYRVDFGPGHGQHAYSRDRGHAEQILRTRSRLGEPAARLVSLWEAPQTPDYNALADWWRSHPRVPAIHAFPAGSVEQGRAMEWEWADANRVGGVMPPLAYYNEIDPYAAQWLRNLIDAGHIAPGIVDERSIEDVRPSDLGGFTQCHFFAGIGVWSLALRRAGWPDDRPVWTGSCPCQPFSAAGKGTGFADERHLWPHFHWLIEQCRPAVVLGEQVASKDAEPWLDLVQADLEAMEYAFGAVPFPSAGVGAPHIRDRLYWVADAKLQQRPGRERAIRADHEARGRLEGAAAIAGFRDAVGLADAGSERRVGQRLRVQQGRPQQASAQDGRRCEVVRLGDSERDGLRSSGRPTPDLANEPGDRALSSSATCGPGPTNGHWEDADWLLCRDGKWRPVEPGTFPLAHGAPARVGRLRAYGNAINAEAARCFIESVMEAA